MAEKKVIPLRLAEQEQRVHKAILPREGERVKLLILAAICLALLSGCVAVDHSTIIDATQSGSVSGQYRDIRQGTIGDFGIFGAGAGAGASEALAMSLTALAAGSGSSGGGGMLGLRVYPAPTQGNPIPFARSIAMINYSNKLTRATVDDTGVVSYEFGEPKSKMPSAFGHQPIQ